MTVEPSQDSGDASIVVSARSAKDGIQSEVAWQPLGNSYLADPYPTLRRLRETDPCHRYTLTGSVLVSRYQDVDRILRDYRRFRNNPGTTQAEHQAQATRPSVGRGLVAADPPTHTRLRRLVRQAFTVQQMANMEGYVRATAHTLLDLAADEGVFDLVSALAKPLPILVIARMIGWPEDDFALLEKWCEGPRRLEPFVQSYRLDAIDPPLSKEEIRDRIRTAVRFKSRLAQLIEERRSSPQDDVVSSGMSPIGIDNLDEAELYCGRESAATSTPLDTERRK